MNSFATLKPEKKSLEKLLLFALIPAVLAAALVLAVLIFRHYRTTVAESPGLLATEGRRPPSPIAEAHAREGFDLLLNQNKPVDAQAIFEACVRDYPDYADAYHGLAIAQREAGDPTKALRNHERALELAPERADYYWWHGVTCQRLNNHAAAINTLKLGLKAADTRHLRPGLLHVTLAQSLRAQGAHKDALSYNEKAIAQNPENAWYYQERGLTHRALGDSARAEADFNKAREMQ